MCYMWLGTRNHDWVRGGHIYEEQRGKGGDCGFFLLNLL